MSPYEAMATKAVEYRDAKGYAATTWDNLPIRLACILSEIEELTEALEDGNMSAVRMESADVAMYAFSCLRDLYDGQWTMRDRYHGGPRIHAAPSELTKPLRREARGAFEAWRKGQHKDVMIRLELLLCALMDLRFRVLKLVSLGCDISTKINMSASRPMLHGGKDPRS